MKSLINKLAGPTPIQRGGFALLTVCLFIVAVWIVGDNSYDPMRGVERAISAAWPGSDESRWVPVAWACKGAVLGLLIRFAFLPVSNWIFKKPKQEISTTLHFKDAESALKYACEYLQSKLAEGQVLPCIIDAVHIDAVFGNIASIRVSSDERPLTMLAAVSNKVSNPRSLEGRLCAALIGPRVPLGKREITAVIVAELSPTWTPKGWGMLRPLAD